MTASSHKTRDSYGRTVTHFTVNGRTVAVVVTLPKGYFEKYGNKYLVNDWASQTSDRVAYFKTRKDAVKAAESVQVRENA